MKTYLPLGQLLFSLVLLAGGCADDSEHWESIRWIAEREDVLLHSPVESLTSPLAISLQGSKVSDEDLRRVLTLRSIEELNFDGTTQVTIGEFRGISELPKLKTVGISELTLDPTEVIKAIGQVKALESLTIRNTDLSAASLKPLENLRSLNRLVLENCQLSDEHANDVGALSWLDLLSISDNPISDRGVRHFDNLKSLRMLDMSNTRITDVAIDHLKEMSKLSLLGASGTGVTIEGIRRLRKVRPELNKVMGIEEIVVLPARKE